MSKPPILIKKKGKLYFGSVSPDAKIILGESIDSSKITLYGDVVEATSFGFCDSLARKESSTIEKKNKTLKRTFDKIGKAARGAQPRDSDKLCVIIDWEDLEMYPEFGPQALKDYWKREIDKFIVRAKGQVAKICYKEMRSND